jgi:uncharacterized protein YkwD
MGRAISTVLAIATGAFAVAGCGETSISTDASGVHLSARQADAKRVAPAPGDGRLGDATAIRPGSPLRELSPGGPLDVRRRGSGPRRDGVGAGAACAGPTVAPAAGSLPAISATTLCLLNGERADHGLAPLTTNAKLAAAATAYAQDLVAGSYFSHTGRDGSGVLDRIQRSGYLPPDAGWVLGENLAWGTGSLATPGAIMQAWMNSPGHRDNILNADYREIGIGIVIGNPAAPDGLGATYATEFGAIEGWEDEADDEPVTAEPPAAAPQASKKHRKRARRRARSRRARHARRAHQSRRGGKGRGKAGGRHGSVRRLKLRGPKAHIAI